MHIEVKLKDNNEAKRNDTIRNDSRVLRVKQTQCDFSLLERFRFVCARYITLIDWDGDVLRSASRDDFQLNAQLSSSSPQSQADPARSVAYNRAREGVARLSQHCATGLSNN